MVHDSYNTALTNDCHQLLCNKNGFNNVAVILEDTSGLAGVL